MSACRAWDALCAVLQSDYTACLGRLMKFPPVENVLWLLERAIQIRDLPLDRKPIPINGPPSSKAMRTHTMPSDNHTVAATAC